LASNSDAQFAALSRKLLTQRYPAPQPMAGQGNNLSDYAGEYRINDKRGFTFVVQNGSLYGRLTGQGLSQLLPAGDDTFVLPGAGAAFTFIRERGQVKTAILRQLGAETVAQRTDEAAPSVAR
jgi:hypothetical protein